MPAPILRPGAAQAARGEVWMGSLRIVFKVLLKTAFVLVTAYELFG